MTTKVKVPQFNGSGDVAYFIRLFKTAVEIGKWSDTTGLTLFNLRQSLSGAAEECGNEEKASPQQVAVGS